MANPSRLFCVLMLLLLAGCAGDREEFRTPHARGYHAGEPEQCVPFARRMSGIELRGDAYSWWDKASPAYERGHYPLEGAVLVLSRTKKLPRGHLAVVTNVINQRFIEVAHSNWGNDKESRSVVYEAMRVEDISTKNNWSQLRFWNHEADQFGFPYPARGFIYPRR